MELKEGATAVHVEAPSESVDKASDLIRFIPERLQTSETDLQVEVIDRVERVLLTEVLSFTYGNLTQTAGILGITRPTFRNKLQHLGIRVDNHAQNHSATIADDNADNPFRILIRPGPYCTPDLKKRFTDHRWRP
jgi:DNA-binding protein Fis